MQCVHELAARNGMETIGATRRKPSEIRGDCCKKLWDSLLEDDFAWATPVSTDDVQLARAEGVSREGLRKLAVAQMQERITNREAARDHLL